MVDPNFIILYVKSAEASADFYSQLLGQDPVEAAPTFAMFRLVSGVMLGFWSLECVTPAPGPVGGGELAFALADKAAVEAQYNRWKQQGMVITQPLCQLDFGYTFVAVDPDGHRLRVFVPGVE